MEPLRRFEPFVQLVDVTDTAALIAWGGFHLRADERGWRVVDDDDLDAEHQRLGTIGAQSPPYGDAVVEVLDASGAVAATGRTAEANHVWVEGLSPDTEYTYRIVVDGRPWADGERWDWVVDAAGGQPQPAGRSYDLRLRTHPELEAQVPVAFLALGDFGVGITHAEHGEHQAGVARTLTWLADRHHVRAVVALGDTIYHGPEDALAQSGDEDDDWYFTYYQPYRYLIDHVPVYPAAGNHDGADEESSDDRAQLEDNFHLHARFSARERAGRASLDPGLFYELGIGALLELVCVDTSWGDEEGRHHFEDGLHRRWLEHAFPPDAGAPEGPGPAWRIPFAHHPPHCAGPHHESMPSQIEHLWPLYRRGGVRLVLAGHEHNLQHGAVDGVEYVISGAGGKLDTGEPVRFDEAGTRSWAAEAHCLLVEVERDRLRITPYAAMGEGDAEPRRVHRRRPDGSEVDEPIVLER